MYPNLSYFFHDLFGTEADNFLSVFQTFGMFLVLAFIAAAYILRLELRRKHGEGLLEASKNTITKNKPPSLQEILLQVLFGFVLGYKLLYIVQNFELFQQSPPDALLSMDGNLLGGIIGAILFGAIKYYEKIRKEKLPQSSEHVLIEPEDRVWDITVVAAISGIVGAKLFAIFESAETISQFLRNPVATFLSGSGLAIYGGLIVAFIVVLLYIKRLKLSPIHIMDAAAPAMIIGYAVGRLGCHFSGDGDWGIVNTAETPSWWFLPDWLWSSSYPRNVLDRGELIPGCAFDHCSILSSPVYPTPLYEVAMSLCIFAILWLLRKRINIAGFIFFLYTFLNGVERWFIEKIRVNDKLDFLGMQLTQAEIISFALIFVGLSGMIWLWRRNSSQAVG